MCKVVQRKIEGHSKNVKCTHVQGCPVLQALNRNRVLIKFIKVRSFQHCVVDSKSGGYATKFGILTPITSLCYYTTLSTMRFRVPTSDSPWLINAVFSWRSMAANADKFTLLNIALDLKYQHTTERFTTAASYLTNQTTKWSSLIAM